MAETQTRSERNASDALRKIAELCNTGGCCCNSTLAQIAQVLNTAGFPVELEEGTRA